MKENQRNKQLLDSVIMVLILIIPYIIMGLIYGAVMMGMVIDTGGKITYCQSLLASLVVVVPVRTYAKYANPNSTDSSFKLLFMLVMSIISIPAIITERILRHTFREVIERCLQK